MDIYRLNNYLYNWHVDKEWLPGIVKDFATVLAKIKSSTKQANIKE